MTILMLETIGDAGMSLLQGAGKVVLSPTPAASEHDLPFGDVTAIITRGMGNLNKALMDKCENLKVVARCGAGLNNVDLKSAAHRNIPVVYAPGLNATSVAEHTLMLMMMTVRQGFCSGVEVKQDNWAGRSDFKGDDLAHKKVCIVGGGNIGGKVAKLCDAFSMDVVMCGRNGGGVNALQSSLKAALPSSDIISIHIPLTAETASIFDDELFDLMKHGATLINTARGELVNTQALLKALNDGRLAGYGADVIDGEAPSLGDPVVAHPNTVITPHVASLTRRTYSEMSTFTAKNVVSILNGQNPDPSSIFTNGT